MVTTPPHPGPSSHSPSSSPSAPSILDPATGQPLPQDAIQRILFIARTVHVYQIPPLRSLRGHEATSWTADLRRHIATCRLSVIETALPSDDDKEQDDDDDEVPSIKTDIVLHDPSSGQLFAAAPYTSPAVIEPTIDSSRFFAVRVQETAPDSNGGKSVGGAGPRTALLGIGFEDRTEAFDFGIALQDAQRSLGTRTPGLPVDDEGRRASSAAKAGDDTAGTRPAGRDWSLKEGETMRLNLPRSGRAAESVVRGSAPEPEAPAPDQDLSAFSLLPPPPPPAHHGSVSSSHSRARGHSLLSPTQGSHGDGGSSVHAVKSPTAQELGFDDGPDGEFA